MLASLDYKAPHAVKLRIPTAQAGSVERFDPSARKWLPVNAAGSVELDFPAGGGVLLRW
jgi:hypothetical protein